MTDEGGYELNERHLESYADKRQGGETHEEAMTWFADMGLDVDGQVLQKAYEERTGKVWTDTSAKALIGDERSARPKWYSGGAAGKRWRYVRARMDHLPEETIDVVHRSSDKVVGLLDPPRPGVAIGTRGLVLGYVQSGKTTNFTAVAAKAADAGFQLVIVLAGIHNALRRQTQQRLWGQLVHDPANWWSGTIRSDFPAEANPPEALLSGRHKRGLLVVKKNVRVLEKLNDWLDRAGEGFRREHAILVIDDEADQAGIDVAPKDTYAGVHAQLRRLLSWGYENTSRVAYIGYTATPYANILTDTDAAGLYPGDFVVDLPRPDGYLGAERLFGSETEPGLDVIRDVPDVLDIDPDDEAPLLLPPSLQDAIDWFVLASAARRVIEDGWTNSSMLVHVSQLRANQLALKEPIQQHLRSLLEDVLQDKAATLDRLRATWETEAGRLAAAELGENAVGYDQLRAHLPETLRRLVEEPECPDPDGDLLPLVARSGVVVDNSLPQARRIAYPPTDDCGVTVIVIGGNTLSRGLTLEGLVCSYFSRTARAYDTLMQMGRWFGFRPGYGHLSRIWMTSELRGWFSDLTQVEAEIRADIRHLEAQGGMTPRDYALRVRTHPQMAITRASAMQHAKQAWASLGDQRLQMTRFNRHDEAWLRHNHDVAVDMLDKALDRGARVHKDAGRAFLLDVPQQLVRDFLAGFRTVDRNLDLRIDLITSWLDAEQEDGRLDRWNIGVIGVTEDRDPIPMGRLGSFRPVIRTHLGDDPDEPVGYIKALMAPRDERADHVADTSVTPMPPSGANRRGIDEPPLLLLYPIDPTSDPGPRSGDRTALGAVGPVVGVALVFPRSHREPVSYMTADLSSQIIEEPETDDPDANPDIPEDDDV